MSTTIGLTFKEKPKQDKAIKDADKAKAEEKAEAEKPSK